MIAREAEADFAEGLRLKKSNMNRIIKPARLTGLLTQLHIALTHVSRMTVAFSSPYRAWPPSSARRGVRLITSNCQ